LDLEGINDTFGVTPLKVAGGIGFEYQWMVW
jgi:hypothetical protein